MKRVYVLLLVFGILILNSCKNKPFDKFIESQFPELNHTDGMIIDGSFAVPIIDTKLTLENFIPSTDSSLWAEVDSNDIIHLRMYYKNAVVLQACQIFRNYYPPNCTGGQIMQGTMVLADEETGTSEWNKLKLYENALDGHLFFDDPKVTFIFKNQIPLVTFFKLDSLIFRRANGEILKDGNIGKYTIDAPTQAGKRVISKVSFTKTEIPNLEYLFEPIPKKMRVQITAGTDQDQQAPYNIPYDYKVSADIDIDLPLIAHLRDLVVGDTSNFTLGDEDPDMIKSVTLKLVLDNELPVSGIGQVVFVDSNYKEIMRLFQGEGWYFASSEVNAQGQTVKAIRTTMMKTLSQDDMKKLKDNNVKYAIFYATFNSPVYNNDSEFDVKIYGWYKLGIKLGMKIDYVVNTDSIPQ